MSSTPAMKFGTITFAEDFDEYVRWLQTGESLGYDLLGYGDSQSLWADTYVALTVAASVTTRARIGPMVTNPVTRHPAVTAGAMASLQQLSGGRAVLGIGTGDSSLLNIGVKPARMAPFAEYCRAVKGLCAGEEVGWQGGTLRMQWRTARVPLWIAAEGPRMLHLAGQIADGVILASGITPDVITDTIGRIRAGAESAGRSLDELELWWLTKPYPADSEEAGWRDLQWTLAGSANHAFKFTFEGKLVPEHLHAPLRELMAGYAADTHAKVAKGSHNASLVERLGLTEFLGRRFTLSGPPELIIERMREAAAHGATNFLLPQMVADRVGFMHLLDEAVIGPLRAGA
jgi:5,10-methylenetetrahydromethanopterin reductase